MRVGKCCEVAAQSQPGPSESADGLGNIGGHSPKLRGWIRHLEQLQLFEPSDILVLDASPFL